jgi:hypothetical protein
MKQSILTRQSDLFGEPSSGDAVTLPKMNRQQAVYLLAKLLSEVVLDQRDQPTNMEPSDEQDQR